MRLFVPTEVAGCGVLLAALPADVSTLRGLHFGGAFHVNFLVGVVFDDFVEFLEQKFVVGDIRKLQSHYRGMESQTLNNNIKETVEKIMANSARPLSHSPRPQINS